eukprot:3039382-Prymnesium_polylepis.1
MNQENSGANNASEKAAAPRVCPLWPWPCVPPTRPARGSETSDESESFDRLDPIVWAQGWGSHTVPACIPRLRR